MKKRSIASLLVVALASAGLWQRSVPDPPPEWAPTPAAPPIPLPKAPIRTVHLPSGEPHRLPCPQARRLIADFHRQLPLKRPAPAAPAFATRLIAWLDPHGLWSAAPGAPTANSIRQRSAEILTELGQLPDTECDAALAVGATLEQWVNQLRAGFDAARAHSAPSGRASGLHASRLTPFQDDPVSRTAPLFASLLGEAVGHYGATFGSEADAVVNAARHRMFPDMPAAGWSEVVLSAAVRAYLPLVDMHSEWVPQDEEWSLYEMSHPSAPDRLWDTIVRTPVGVLIGGRVSPPLSEGDLVLAVAGVPTAGMAVEQVEQLALLEAYAKRAELPITILGSAADSPETVLVRLGAGVDDSDPAGAISRQMVPYGSAEVAIYQIEQVDDDLGEQLTWRLTEDAESGRLAGVLLDLRGNGGGSIRGARDALSAFLPSIPIFSALRRDGTVFVEFARGATPAWTGPLGVLVDGNTASAAEMIAAALTAHGRALVTGEPTFGKGCIQEYFPDQASRGALRVTTMVFAGPSGAAIQGAGVIPDLPLQISPITTRESQFSATLPPWSGPELPVFIDVISDPWGIPDGPVGPCVAPVHCQAVNAIRHFIPSERFPPPANRHVKPGLRQRAAGQP